MAVGLIQQLLALAGAAVGSYVAYGLVTEAVFALRRSSISSYCHAADGSWALVTGASDGIGFSFADVLAERGFNVLLHARNQEKLARRIQELQQNYPGRSFEMVVADASRSDESFVLVAEKARNLPGKLTLIVNNVGGQTMQPQYSPHWETSHADIDRTINMNARFPTHLTRALVPTLVENAPAAILNCGSVGGLFGVPYITTYTSCKAYVHIFTSALKNDLLAEGVKGVDTTGFIIGNVRSATNKDDIPFFTLDPRECAIACLSKVNAANTLVVPHWKHRLQLAFNLFLPDFAWRRILASEMRTRVDAERRRS